MKEAEKQVSTLGGGGGGGGGGLGARRMYIKACGFGCRITFTDLQSVRIFVDQQEGLPRMISVL